MKVHIQVPIKIQVRDYHEIDVISSVLRRLSPKLKIKEIGFDGDYYAIIYTGKLRDPENARVVQEIQSDTYV